jgi:hypothetical protein
MNANYPVYMHNSIISVVNNDTRAVDIPGTLSPGAPPGRVILPAVWRIVNVVLLIQNILNWAPIVNVDIVAIIRAVSSAPIGRIPFDRFYDDFFPIEIFISYNLKDGISSANYINFNNGHILDVISVYQCLQDNGMKIPLPFVSHPNVIDPSIIIQVQVVDPIIFCIKLPFKIP